MICLSLTAPLLEENRRALDHYRAWIRLAELRIDRLAPDQHAHVAAFLNGLPAEGRPGFVLTIRTIDDGGVWAFGEDERRGLLRSVLEAVNPGIVQYVDIEADRSWPEVEDAALRSGARIIRSFHNFAGTPGDLVDRLPAMYRQAGDVAKAAVMVRGMADLAALLEAARILRAGGRPFLLIGMGPCGIATRILASRIGSLFTFASSSLQGHVAAAPGHMDPELLAEGFGYYSIGPQTRIFGIIGNPVLHSRSPAFHNRIFQDKGLEAVYLPFQVDDLAAFMRVAELLPVSGCSVTIPHKEAVLAHLSSTDQAVREIGACNTLLRRDGGWYGTNTDAPGFFQPLAALLAGEQRKRAVVIGAGGAARAVVQALLANGYRVLVLNRSAERVRQLAEDFRGHYAQEVETGQLPADGETLSSAELEHIASYAEVVVQTTSVGMVGHDEGRDPFAFHTWRGTEVAYDIIYTPERTAFLARAAAAGCRTINGCPMFEQQALLQSSLFRYALN